MLKTTNLVLTALYLFHATPVVAGCGSTEAPCILPVEHEQNHAATLSNNLYKILPSAIDSSQGALNFSQTRAEVGTNLKGNAAKSNQTEPLGRNRFSASRPDRAPVDFYGMSKQVESDKLIGVYMRGKLPVADTLNLSGTIGYTHATISKDQGRELANDSDVSYGLGTELQMSEDLSLSVDYIQFIDSPQVEHTGVNLGLKGRF